MAVNQLKAGAFLSYVLLMLNTLIGLFYTPVLLRMLGQSEYGLYSLAASVVAYLTVLDFGFGNAIIRYTAKFRAEDKEQEQQEMFGMFFLLYLLISAIALSIAMLLVWKVDVVFDANMTAEEVHRMRIILLLMAFNLAFTFPMSIWGAIITAYENFVFQKVLNIVRTLLNPVLMLVLLFMGYKAIALVMLATALNILTLCINCFYCRKRLHVRLKFGRFNWAFLKEILAYSFWVFLNAIMDRIYWSTGQLVLGVYRGTTAVAVYAVAIQLENMYMNFSTAISGVFLPKVTGMVTHQSSNKEISNLFIKTGRIQFIVLAFILTGFVVFGRQFIMLWAGADYGGAYAIALLFLVPLTVPLIQNLGITILMARNQMKFRSILYVIIAGFSLWLSICWAEPYGGVGCAMAIAVALCVGQIVGMNIYYAKKQEIDILAFWKEIGKMAIVPLVVGVVAYIAVQQVVLDALGKFVGAIALFSLVYIPLFWAGSMNAYERDLFMTPMKKLLGKCKNRNDKNN